MFCRDILNRCVLQDKNEQIHSLLDGKRGSAENDNILTKERISCIPSIVHFAAFNSWWNLSWPSTPFSQTLCNLQYKILILMRLICYEMVKRFNGTNMWFSLERHHKKRTQHLQEIRNTLHFVSVLNIFSVFNITVNEYFTSFLIIFIDVSNDRLVILSKAWNSIYIGFINPCIFKSMDI